MTFKDNAGLIAHENSVHSNLSCRICNLTFKHKNLLAAHENSAHLSLKCRTCNSSFQDQKTLYEHFRTVHEKEKEGNFKAKRSRKYPDDNETGDSILQDYPNCIECGLVYRDQESLKEHIEVRHENLMHKCSQCDYKTKGRKQIREHMRNKHTLSGIN